MRVNIDDPALRARTVNYLREHQNMRSSALAAALNMNQVSCDRLLKLLQHEGVVYSRERAMSGLGRPARLWSALTVRAPHIEKTPAEMVDDIQLVMMGQPWPSWWILPRPGEGMAEYPD